MGEFAPRALARLVRSGIFAALLAAPAAGQFISLVGPPKVPLGAGVVIGVTNHSGDMVGIGVAPYDIVGPNGPVDLGLMTMMGIVTEPGETFLAVWDQTDQAGVQVPPGTYTVNVHVPGDTVVPHTIEIGAFDAGVALTTPPLLGQTVGFRLEAPGDAGLPYLLAASTSATLGIPTCAGTFPLDPDLLWVLSLAGGDSFQGWSGALGADGVSSVPTLDLPANPAFAGWSFHVAFATVDPSQFCSLASISEATAVTIL
jgi:hypothetical protein